MHPSALSELDQDIVRSVLNLSPQTVYPLSGITIIPMHYDVIVDTVTDYDIFYPVARQTKIFYPYNRIENIDEHVPTIDVPTNTNLRLNSSYRSIENHMKNVRFNDKTIPMNQYYFYPEMINDYQSSVRYIRAPLFSARPAIHHNYPFYMVNSCPSLHAYITSSPMEVSSTPNPIRL